MTRILRDRNAGLYFTGLVVSAFGTSALGLAAGVWVKDLSGSNGLAALCVFAVWAPTLAGPALGTIADRVRRKPLLLRTNLVLAALLLTLFAVDSRANLWLLFTVLFVYGTVMVVQDPAESALVAAVVDPDLLGDFNGLRMSAVEGMKLVAPLTGAGLYTAFGGPAVACLDAVTCALAAGLWLFVRAHEERPRRPAGDWRAQTTEGVRELWGHPGLRPLVLAGGTMMFLASLTSSTSYAIVEALGHAPAYTGVLYAAQGVGSATVGLVSGPALRRLGERRFAAAGIALAAAGVTARAVPSDPVVLAAGAAVGLGLPCVLIAAFTAVQREVPGPLLGRATATANTLLFTPNVIGLAGGAALVELADFRLLLPLVGLALLTTGAYLGLVGTGGVSALLGGRAGRALYGRRAAWPLRGTGAIPALLGRRAGRALFGRQAARPHRGTGAIPALLGGRAGRALFGRQAARVLPGRGAFATPLEKRASPAPPGRRAALALCRRRAAPMLFTRSASPVPPVKRASPAPPAGSACLMPPASNTAAAPPAKNASPAPPASSATPVSPAKNASPPPASSAIPAPPASPASPAQSPASADRTSDRSPSDANPA